MNGAGPPSGYSEHHVGKVHSEGIRQLGNSFRDCVRMTGIAAELMLNAKIEDDHVRFAMMHSDDMLRRLDKEYVAGWHGSVSGEVAHEFRGRRRSAPVSWVTHRRRLRR
jgi:hypothetical protein